jgi:hypothetical protein
MEAADTGERVNQGFLSAVQIGSWSFADRSGMEPRADQEQGRRAHMAS